jgi:hypothetical protein
MKNLEYDSWKQQTPPESNSEEKERCRACLELFKPEKLITLDINCYKLNHNSLVCDECKELIHKELEM